MKCMHLTGTLDAQNTLTGALNTRNTLAGILNTYVPKTGQQYKGLYKIKPLADYDVILKTKNKLLEEDITVLKIPYYETSNTFDGLTVVIGGEYE